MIVSPGVLWMRVGADDWVLVVCEDERADIVGPGGALYRDTGYQIRWLWVVGVEGVVDGWGAKRARPHHDEGVCFRTSIESILKSTPSLPSCPVPASASRLCTAGSSRNFGIEPWFRWYARPSTPPSWARTLVYTKGIFDGASSCPFGGFATT